MGIRAYTGGQLGNSTTADNPAPTGLTVEEVQDVIGVALNNAVQGGTTVYDDVTGTIGITLPNAEVATSTSAGAIIPGTGLTIDANGIVTPNVATATTTGIVRIGTGLAVDGFGTLSAVVSSAGATALSGLTDVDTNGVTTGQILKYDGTTFVPADDAGIADYNNLTNLPTLFDGNYTSLTNLPAIPVDTGDLTDIGNLLGGGGGGGISNVVEDTTPQLGGDLDGLGKKVLFANMYPTEADLPSASTYHGMFAHVHATGKAYFAHAGAWVRLADFSEVGGADGADGVDGVDGADGADGAAGVDGADGAQGIQGVAGAAGATGAAGADGETIVSALVDANDDLIITTNLGTVINAGNSTGATGAAGPQGTTGATGSQGIQGLQGLGVASATVDANDDLIIVLSDGSQLNAGNTAGPQGIQGIQGSTGSTGSVGPAGNGVASATVDANDDLQITLTDGSVINAGNTAGPQGIQGIQGATGATGSAGLNGLSVISAVKDANDDLQITLSDNSVINAGNITGPQGIQGATGTAGADSTVAGPAGADGIDGAAGVDGADGATGPAGAAGPQGVAGADGADGADGSNGIDLTAFSITTGALTANGGLAYDNTTGVFTFNPATGGGSSNVTSIGTLSDVDVTGLTDGQVLAFDSGSNTWEPTAMSGGGASTLSALTDVSTTAPAIGQAIAWDGSEWAPTTISGGGGGAASGIFRAEVTVNYASNGSLSSVSVLSGGISATVVDSTSTVCTVEFEFTGSVCNPLSIQVYGYQRVANQYVTRALASDFSNRKVAAGGSSGSPTAFNSYNPATNKLTLSLTKSLTGASGGLGQTTEAIVSFLLSNS